MIINPCVFKKFLEPVFVEDIIIGFHDGKEQGFAKSPRSDKK
jgi:hypothetical protein